MFKEVISLLYKVSRTTGTTASAFNDVRTLASGDKNKIMKRVARKTINKIARDINKKI